VKIAVPLALAAAAPLLIGAGDSNLSTNFAVMNAHATVGAMFYAATVGDESMFKSTVELNAQLDNRDTKTGETTSSELSITAVNRLARSCLVSEIHACNGNIVQLSWSCAGSKDPSYSLIELARGKVKRLETNAPPTVCTAPNPEKFDG